MSQPLTPAETELCTRLQVEIIQMVRRHDIKPSDKPKIRILILALVSTLTPALSDYLGEDPGDKNIVSKQLFSQLVETVDADLLQVLTTTVTAAIEVIKQRQGQNN